MDESRRNLYVVAAIACAGLASSIRTGVLLARAEARLAAPGAASACVDAEARREVEELRRSMARRDALARLAPQEPAPVAGPPAPFASGAAPPDDAEPMRVQVPKGEIRRYARFDVSNPAITVTQKEDGTYDVKTSDPTLTGTIVVVKATDVHGVEDTLTMKIPPPP